MPAALPQGHPKEMNNLEQRLVSVFQNAFPDVPEDRLTSVTQENTQSWDSVAAITLMNLIEEEFEMQLDFEDLADLTSFALVRDYLAAKLAQPKV